MFTHTAASSRVSDADASPTAQTPSLRQVRPTCMFHEMLPAACSYSAKLCNCVTQGCAAQGGGTDRDDILGNDVASRAVGSRVFEGACLNIEQT